MRENRSESDYHYSLHRKRASFCMVETEERSNDRGGSQHTILDTNWNWLKCCCWDIGRGNKRYRFEQFSVATSRTFEKELVWSCVMSWGCFARMACVKYFIGFSASKILFFRNTLDTFYRPFFIFCKIMLNDY